MPVSIPNARRVIVPDVGYHIVAFDLAGADAQVVAWDSGSRFLKTFFKGPGQQGKKIHAYNAEAMFGAKADGTEYSKQDRPYKACKIRCHAYNYGAKPRARAREWGSPLSYETQFYNKWFKINPEVLAWQRRILANLQRGLPIRNAFGYIVEFYNDPDQDLKEALAWIGQSTVSIATQRAQLQAERACPWAEQLLNEHDEIVFQIKDEDMERLPELRKAILVTIPYKDPLVIPWSEKASRVSWGDC